MGKLFAIEGTDGSGKQTQFTKLCERLKADGINFRTVSFPNYDSPSSSLVKMYLSGEFGKNAKDVSAYIASTFYAADRYATFQKGYKKYYDEGGIILADRYTTSNMMHQASKIKDEEERKKFIEWLFDFEYNLYSLPMPTKVFFLNMPTSVALDLIKNRDNKFSHTSKKDIHEKNPEYLEQSYKAACDLAKKYGWEEIRCVNENNSIKTIDEIHEEIFKIISKEI